MSSARIFSMLERVRGIVATPRLDQRFFQDIMPTLRGIADCFFLSKTQTLRIIPPYAPPLPLRYFTAVSVSCKSDVSPVRHQVFCGSAVSHRVRYGGQPDSEV